MQRNGISFGTLIYLIIGFIVAANRSYFVDLGTLSGIISAILGVVLWPLLLLGVNLHVVIG